MTPDLLPHLVAYEKAQPVVRNAARRSTGTYLTWGRTAALVEPGYRHYPSPDPPDRGVHQRRGYFRTPSGVYGRSSGYRDDAGRAEHQEALAAEDERMHGELLSVVPGMTVRGFHGDYIAHPFVTGSSTAGIAVLRKRLTGAGYSLVEDEPTFHNDIEYVHPEGHMIVLGSHPSTGSGRPSRRRVEYYPNWKPDHSDPMSRAADAASMKAHIKTGHAVESENGSRESADRLDEAAALHGEAALAHGVAFDKAAEEGRTEDAARHARAVSYHQFVASKL